ncbi:MAG: hypothetical protein H7326_05035 [Bdellovibrionaceae bacterium]|nr:hypothetical protein [Pseudobdellovibrionaceae bacterium]
MKLFLFLISFVVALTAFAKTRTPASAIKGTSQVVMENRNGWVRIEGEAAKAMYEALDSVPRNNNEGAGDTTFFKDGKSYGCVFEKSANAYQCDIYIKDFSKGIFKN